MASVPDISGLFDTTDGQEVDDKLQETRNHLRDYQRGRELENQGKKMAKDAKEAIEKVFNELPDEVKTTINDKPTTVAGETFSRVRKVIELDGWLIIMKQRVDTTFDRKVFFSMLEREPRSRSYSQQQREAIQIAVDNLKSNLHRRMSPHVTNVISVERKKGSRSSSRRDR